MIVPPTRPSIINNPLPNHNFGKGPRINGLMTKERSKEDLSVLIYNLLECFMMTSEELMDRTSTTTTRYDIWNEEVPEPKNYQTLTNGGRHFKPQDTDPNNPTKIAHITRGETLQTPTFGDRQPSGSFEQIHPTNTCRRR